MLNLKHIPFKMTLVCHINIIFFILTEFITCISNVLGNYLGIKIYCNDSIFKK